MRKTVRGSTPRIDFSSIAKHVLGKEYELSLVVCGDDLARRMNASYRKKTYKPNVLSFPLSKSEGEIFLNVRKAAREAREYGVSHRERLTLLYVHGLWHLKGFDHGAKMEALEKQTLKKFGFAAD
ncbi:MAG: rRNA maturation RNase YbeY [Candidatus Kaiserbacteria bacterium]|nr:rRNA maturation RNase YbeY [Candidatus Kaiserbacteria bacterium]